MKINKTHHNALTKEMSS